MRRALIVWAILGLVGLGCWGLVDSDDAGGRFWPDSDDGGLVDGSDASTSGGPADGSSQDSASDGPETCDSPVEGLFNCCNGKPCRGRCDSNGDCSCGDSIPGGCSAPTVCCYVGDICVSEAHCKQEDTPYNGPVYDGGTDCAPMGNGYDDTSCCEGVPCWGNCELHDGAWQCTCTGIPGGCGQFGLICCWGGCMQEGNCGFDH
jgi:hypothetical protein